MKHKNHSNNHLFDKTVDILDATADKLGITYEDLNVIGMYVIVPAVVIGAFFLGLLIRK